MRRGETVSFLTKDNSAGAAHFITETLLAESFTACLLFIGLKCVSRASMHRVLSGRDLCYHDNFTTFHWAQPSCSDHGEKVFLFFSLTGVDERQLEQSTLISLQFLLFKTSLCLFVPNCRVGWLYLLQVILEGFHIFSHTFFLPGVLDSIISSEETELCLGYPYISELDRDVSVSRRFFYSWLLLYLEHSVTDVSEAPGFVPRYLEGLAQIMTLNCCYLEE